MYLRSVILVAGLALLTPRPATAETQVLTPRLHHLRADGPPEWSDFPAQAEGPNLRLRFQSKANPREYCLRLRQQDVRQTWKVLLNGKEIGRLVADENDMAIAFPVPAGALNAGENTLAIEQVGNVVDDIRVGEIALDDRSVKEVLSEATVEIQVRDAGLGTRTALPCRITVLNAQGALAAVGAESKSPLAVRTGVIYTANGRARFGVPAGEYTIFAGRGFAYGIDSTRIVVKPGEVVQKTLAIRREVPTPGWVSCDTHVHTLTYSGHGDATLDERMVTIAGEDIQLPIATDHNRQISYHAAAVKHGVRKYFTPVVGNEVTTAVGHFNIFPAPAGDDVPDFKSKDWLSIFADIKKRTAARVIILNHARDVHSGFRPFGPEHHNALIGENLDGWALGANAMEVVNSGAQQTDLLRLYRDWFGLLNRGLSITPVGASDSHDVSRYIIGQGRTYIRAAGDDPAEIRVDEAVNNFLTGRVLVSCGLLVDMAVNDKYGPGDLVPAADEISVRVRVLGPSWVTADTVELYANGIKIREAKIAKPQSTPAKWEGVWKLPRLGHDVHLVAVATGPGVSELYWPIARPYQPTSPHVKRRVIGSTGAVWIDADGDGKRTSAYEYAHRLMKAHGRDVTKLVPALADYDETVAAQVAGLLQARGVSALDAPIIDAARKAGPHVERGFEAFAEAWRECQIARSKKRS
jgi:hypothetical protein